MSLSHNEVKFNAIRTSCRILLSAHCETASDDLSNVVHLLYWSDGTSVATLKGYWSNLAHLLYGYIEVRTGTP